MNSIRLALVVNGQPLEVEVSPDRTLLSFLREEMGLFGAKNGCNKGHCGTCTVIIDGEARRSCIVKMGTLAGKTVETIENLNREGRLHPLQEAFVREGAVQCGFCTPGMILASKALLDKNPNPTEEEIKHALRNNLCRCTGYKKIIAAVKKAAAVLRGEDFFKPARIANSGTGGKENVFGQSVVRRDAWSKVKGEPIYTDDLRLPDMLHGKLVLSEHPHAEIVSIDKSRALAHPGVVAVYTAADIPGRKTFGLVIPHQPVLAEDRVRYVGDPVAMVLAETPEAAAEAARLVSVEYRPLPGVFSPEEALAQGAPELHSGGNILKHVHFEKGDAAAGFAKADVIVEGTYFVPFIEHAYLEPEAGLARLEEDGSITVWTANQGSFPYQRMIAASLDIPVEKVRVIYMMAGGAFGGREEPTVQIHCALGALKTGRPVKIVLSREESIRMSTKRHAEYLHYRTGATRDGKVVATEIRIYTDTGAYASLGTSVATRSATFAAGPYEIPNAKVDVYAVYTNQPPGGAMRGFGSPQVAFAGESQMDRLARELGMDPIRIREINALEPGKVTITGHRLGGGVGLKECLAAVKRELNRSPLPQAAPGKRIGVGVACAYKNVGLGGGYDERVAAWMDLRPDGTVLLRVGCVDNGQGSDSAMAQIAAQASGVSYDLIRVLASDTAETPDAGVTTGSRMVFLSGNACLGAGLAFAEAIRKVAAEELGVEPEAISIEGDRVRGIGAADEPGQARSLRLADLASRLAARGQKVQARYTYEPPKTNPVPERVPTDPADLSANRLHFSYCFGAQAAVVEVDEKDGSVRVLKLIAAHDLGRIVNPIGAEGQVEGGAVMGLGYALSEEFRCREGKIETDNLARLRLPKITDLPELTTILVEDVDPNGPYGAKGMSELPVSPTAPAVCNAIYDAVGVRVTALPATKEKVKALLDKKGLQEP